MKHSPGLGRSGQCLQEASLSFGDRLFLYLLGENEVRTGRLAREIVNVCDLSGHCLGILRDKSFQNAPPNSSTRHGPRFGPVVTLPKGLDASKSPLRAQESVARQPVLFRFVFSSLDDSVDRFAIPLSC